MSQVALQEINEVLDMIDKQLDERYRVLLKTWLATYAKDKKSIDLHTIKERMKEIRFIRDNIITKVSKQADKDA